MIQIVLIILFSVVLTTAIISVAGATIWYLIAVWQLKQATKLGKTTGSEELFHGGFTPERTA